MQALSSRSRYTKQVEVVNTLDHGDEKIEICLPGKWIESKNEMPPQGVYVQGWNENQVIRCKYSEIRKCWLDENNYETDIKLWKPETRS